MKTCTKCGAEKPLTEFYHSVGRISSRCKPCVRAATKSYAQRNPERVRAQNWKSKYGITPEDFERMRATQGDACACCRGPFTGTPVVDHCHITGRVRGLLHAQCNSMIGMARESPAFLRLGAEYLERN